MNLTFGSGSIRKGSRTSRWAATAGALLLTAVALISASEVLRDRGEPATVTTEMRAVPRSIGPVIDEPDFGSVPADFSAFVQTAGAGPIAGRQDEIKVGQASDGSVVDLHFGTTAESVSALEGDYLDVEQPGITVVDRHFGTGEESVSALEGEYLR